MSATSGGRPANTVRRLSASSTTAATIAAPARCAGDGAVTVTGRAPRRSDETTRRSASIRAAVASSGGSRSRRIASIERAARVRGEVDRGDHPPAAVADRRRDRAQALLELLVDDRPALRATRSSSARSASRRRHRVAATAAQLRPARGSASSSLVGQPGEQHAAHRGRVGREARADVDRHGHDPRVGHARDVDDVLAVEHRRPTRTRAPPRRAARGAARRPRAA